jgi:hypothetical protein
MSKVTIVHRGFVIPNSKEKQLFKKSYFGKQSLLGHQFSSNPFYYFISIPVPNVSHDRLGW